MCPVKMKKGQKREQFVSFVKKLDLASASKAAESLPGAKKLTETILKRNTSQNTVK